MKKITKSVSKVFMAILAGGLLLSGCGKEASSDKGTAIAEVPYTVDAKVPSWKVDTRENNKLTWYVNAEWFNTEYGKDTITKKLKEELNLDIEFITGDDTKLNTFFAGGQMPDLITLFGGATPAALKADTWALPLGDLADAYDPYFYEVAQKQTLDWYQLADGKSYGYPSYSNTQADYDSGAILGGDAFVIRKDVYEAIGSPSMGTEEEFLAALDKIKQQFPELTPFGFRSFGENGDTGSLGGIVQDYLGVPIVNDAGEFYDRNIDEEYLKWIQTFNEAYKKGYISDDNFADDNTIFEEKVAQGKYGCMFISGAAQLSAALVKNMSTNVDQTYIAVDGPKSDKYGGPTINQSGLSGWTVTYVTKQCTNPSKAIQLFTYLLSEEGQYLTMFGVEGETYSINENKKAVLLPEVAKMRDENPEQYKKEYRLGEFWFFGHDKFVYEKGENQINPAIVQIQEWSKGKLKPQFLIENTDPDNGTVEARNYVNIKTTWATTLASSLRAATPEEFNSIIETYKQFLESNHFADIVKVKNEKIKANAEKLGIAK